MKRRIQGFRQYTIENQNRSSYYQISMIIFFLIATFLGLGAHSQTTFYYYFDTVSKYGPSYKLGLIQAGTTIDINVTTLSNNGPHAYQMGSVFGAFQADTYPTTSVACSMGCSSSSSCFASCPILITQYYRINISQSSSPSNTNGNNPRVLQHFQLQASSYPSNQTAQNSTVLLQLTETFRDRVAKLLYISSAYQAQFSLYPALENSLDNPNLAQTNLHLYKVSSITGTDNVYDITNQQDILTNSSISAQSYSSSNKTLSYRTTLQQGFYVLVTTYLKTNINLIRLGYPSDNYICPYPSSYPDYYSNFMGCSVRSPINPGFPCLTFDSIKEVCTSCATTYSLINGTCKVVTMCPPRQYFHFGVCYPVDEKCDDYDAFTGWCLTCKDVKMTIEQGKCKAIQIQCQDRQYLKEGVCIDISPLCQLYNISTGDCFSCYGGAYLTNNTCLPIVITCAPRQYFYNSICYDIPTTCASFDVSLRICLVCTTGYSLNNGNCIQIVCPQRQYLSGNNCKEVSTLCDSYDHISGDCLSCKYSGYQVHNGQCLQVVSPLAGCREREMMGFGECGETIQNCAAYNLVTNNCEQCIEGWFLDYTKKCTQKHQYCHEDEILIQGICVQKPSNCLQIDALGFCALCNGTVFQLQQGQCVFKQRCPEGKFLVGSQCVNVTPGCTVYNPTFGQCLTCYDGRPAFEGLCCPQGQIGYKFRCYDQSLVPKTPESINNNANSVPYCVAYHPTMGRCLQCNANYQVDPEDMLSCK